MRIFSNLTLIMRILFLLIVASALKLHVCTIVKDFKYQHAQMSSIKETNMQTSQICGTDTEKSSLERINDAPKSTGRDGICQV